MLCPRPQFKDQEVELKNHPYLFKCSLKYFHEFLLQMGNDEYQRTADRNAQ